MARCTRSCINQACFCAFAALRPRDRLDSERWTTDRSRGRSLRGFRREPLLECRVPLWACVCERQISSAPSKPPAGRRAAPAPVAPFWRRNLRSNAILIASASITRGRHLRASALRASSSSGRLASALHRSRNRLYSVRDACRSPAASSSRASCSTYRGSLHARGAVSVQARRRPADPKCKI